MAMLFGGFDDAGQPRSLAYADLIRKSEEWPTTVATPPGVAELLTTARAVFALAWFHYELLVVACMWSLLAVEAALRVRLTADPGHARRKHEPSFSQLVRRARQEGLLTPGWAERLDAAREMRNRLAHAQEQQTWSVGIAAPIVAAAHELIAVLYPDQ
jgi:hypothetical protein